MPPSSLDIMLDAHPASNPMRTTRQQTRAKPNAERLIINFLLEIVNADAGPETPRALDLWIGVAV